MKKALAQQVAYLEIDVRTTLDGEVVVFHDGTLNRTTRSKGPLKDLTLTQLKDVRLKKAGKDERVPTLEEACRLIADWNNRTLSQTQFYVDCKEVSPTQLIGILKKYNLHRDAVFYGSNGTLLAIKDIFPEAKLMPGLRSGNDLESKEALINPYAFDVAWKVLTPELVRLIHQKDIKIFTDLLALQDKKKNYRKAAEMGIDVIQTDRARRAGKSLTRYYRN